LWRATPAAGRIGTDGAAWLLPPGAGTRLKVSSSAVCRQVDTVGAEPDDRWADKLDLPSILSDAGRYTVLGSRDCHYLTGGPPLVRLAANVLAHAACGGGGFRTAPLVADRIAACLAGEGERTQCP
jgi:hypothetical protein